MWVLITMGSIGKNDSSHVGGDCNREAKCLMRSHSPGSFNRRERESSGNDEEQRGHLLWLQRP